MILDSCFLVDLLAADEAATVKLDELVEDGVSLAVSTLSVTEVRRGIAQEETTVRSTFDEVLSGVLVVPYGRDEARRAGHVLRRLDGDGQPIGVLDGMIAATALERDGRVLTRNVSEFRRVDGLRVVPY